MHSYQFPIRPLRGKLLRAKIAAGNLPGFIDIENAIVRKASPGHPEERALRAHFERALTAPEVKRLEAALAAHDAEKPGLDRADEALSTALAATNGTASAVPDPRGPGPR